MSVADSITNALLRFGRPMTLRRHNWSAGVDTPNDVTIYGVTEGYAPQELVNGITQGDVKVTFSNAQIAAATWPGPPAAMDALVIDGRSRSILGVEPKYLSTEVLVFVCQVRG